MTKLSHRVRAAGGVVAVMALVLSPVVASAATDTETTQVRADLQPTITLTTSTTVTMTVTPTSDGRMSSASDTVTVATNNATGYNLTLANADTNRNLVNAGNTIAPDTGTFASPSATLANNTWGYRVDGAGGFGAGPTSAEASVASSVYSWAGVPASGSPSTLKTTATNTVSDTTTVWYGVKVDTGKPSGLYSDSVTYTATTN